ncbi:MAG: peptide chain release factor N(5)-glutamine methyltransferase [Chitinophagaceae bacterium]|nr:MAG: peptide chain release factor N(5)-glutamine methyltransferase [Chitinophagaceae bacterium]
MTLTQAQVTTRSMLLSYYDTREAAQICDWVLEHVTGKKRIDRLIDKEAMLTADQQLRLAQILAELQSHRPIQYVLGEAWFAGMQFFVNEAVLIPRPETEELVEWIGEDRLKAERLTRNAEEGTENNEYRTSNIEHRISNKEQRTKIILDIGTGSGCIPISLTKKLPSWSVTAIDVSEAALMVARKNAADLEVDVQFLQTDFLDEWQWPHLPVVDLIVSNPPYIKVAERQSMAKHVLDFEPSLALFVPDDDALLFYRKIAAFGKTHLRAEGAVFVEINEALGQETVSLFEQQGYTVTLRKDLQGKDRMIKATLPH